ncbi:MAG: response regulator [Desulfuromonas sp.]|nr:response regulator [Desulfuromonas sp.]
MAKRKKFGEVLFEEGVIDEQTLRLALEKQAGSGKRLGQILEEQNVISERDIVLVLARQFGLKTVKNIAAHNFPTQLLDLIDSEKALQKLIFPLRIEEKTLCLAMVNPLDMETIDTLSFATGLRIVPYLTTPREVHAAINRHYLKTMNEPIQGGWWKILVIDNQEPVLTTTAAALKKVGFDVITCNNCVEALPIAVNKRPHLIITEIVMPRMGGVDLYNSLSKNPQTENIPFIASSSRSTAKEEAELLDMGFVDFIAKPINCIRLVARSKRVLRLIYDGLQTPPNQ